ncbi:uncharacterized protein N7459_006959 [Penicillium hispanicum]|uniref:uncharacterized protein n=1 Tax=Penicillium hispanicum TaxID=1080232 RepID=UPI00253F8025|nr:uncharacterized protein N7459_006959 [Penicillium hispanicum]KAJ5577995.1 hypothetical protein N7459_006959 [Penicillium hispanicum]
MSASLLFSKVGATKEKNKQVFMMKIPEGDLKEKDLKHLKSLMASQKDAKEYAFLPFCNQAGAVVDNSWKIQDYVDTVKTGDTDKKPKTYDFYLFEKPALDSKIIPKIELKLPDDVKYLDPAVLKKLESSIELASWRAAKGSGQNCGPAQLKENDWNIVVTSNSLCYGLSIVRMIRGSGDKAQAIPIGVTRARQPAFQIKARSFKVSDEAEPKLRVPDFIVDDQSYVSIYETKSQFQSSLSESSISTWDILRSGAMSFLGNSVGTSAGYTQSNSEQSYEIKEGETARMNISYNFPRATLILDEYSLELTQKCEEDLALVKDKVSLEKFLEIYGEYFSREVQVGGRLFASEDFEWKGEGSGSDVKKSMKIQAASSLKLDIKGVGLEGGVQGGYGQGSGTKRTDTQGAMENTLQWQANGGDTLLCNNPPEWCPTVAPHHNWRVTNRAGNYRLLDMIAKFPDQDRIREFIKKGDYQKVMDSLKPKSGRKFYLRNGNQFQYLTAYQESKVPDEVKKNRPAGSSKAFGTAIFAPSAPECEKWSGLYFEFETLQGEMVQKVEYAKPYVLKNSATGLYVRLGEAGLLSAGTKPPNEFVFLRSGALGENLRGEVNQKAAVSLGISQMTGDNPARVHSSITWYGNHGILGVSSFDQLLNVSTMYFQLFYEDREKA